MSTTIQSTHDLLDEALGMCSGEVSTPPTVEHLKAMFEHHISLTAEIADLNDQLRELREAMAPERAIDDIEHAAEYLAACVRAEMVLEEERPLVKSAAIRRIMRSENPDTGKPHSASSAEKIVEDDKQYAAHRAQQIDAVCAKIEAASRLEATKLRARLALELGGAR